MDTMNILERSGEQFILDFLAWLEKEEIYLGKIGYTSWDSFGLIEYDEDKKPLVRKYLEQLEEQYVGD